MAPHTIYLIQLAFTAWMLWDAYRRPADSYWFWLILLVPFVGAWGYFFLVKLEYYPDLAGLFFGPREPSLEELRFRAEQAPTLATDLALAEALMERNQHQEAVPHLESALKREPDNCQALYALAVCRVEQGHPEDAFGLLGQIIARDRCWADYSAWRLLIAARGQNGDGQGALAACRELVRFAPTMQFRCLLAERLMIEGQAEEAQAVLEEALETYRYSPGPIRRHNRRWARHARRLQKQALAGRT